MNNLPARELRRLVRQYGFHLGQDAPRCRGLLSDVCGQHRREISLLITAIDEGVPAEIIRNKSAPQAMVISRLVGNLERDRSLNPAAARWTVEAWAFALGELDTIPTVVDDTITDRQSEGDTTDELSEKTIGKVETREAISRGESESGSSRRAKWLVIAAVAAVLLIGGAIATYALTRDSQNEAPLGTSTFPTPADSPTPEPSATAEEPSTYELLLDRIPDKVAASCEETGTVGDALVGASCFPQATDEAHYFQFSDLSSMRIHYKRRARSVGARGGSCTSSDFAESTFRGSNGEVSGRLLCFKLDGVAYVEWINTELAIYAWASRTDGASKRLFKWWTDAGPY